jgi:hypothetical protein
MIGTLAPYRLDQPLGEAVLPGRACGSHEMPTVVALSCLLLALFASPFKPKSRLEV